MKGIGIWHFGILTESFTVIDHGPNGTRERPIKEFSDGERLHVEPHSNPHVSRLDVIQRARSFIGRWKYNAIFKNCEHFVNHCRNGYMRSKQVGNRVKAIIISIIILGIVIHLFKKNKE